jgi:hypothetical protein
MAIFTVSGGSVESVYAKWKDKKAVPETAESNAQCALLVQELSAAPSMSEWTQGSLVKGGSVTAGTAVATFNKDGAYDGSSGTCHAAIFIKETAVGIEVWDQWKNGHLAQRKLDGFKHGRRVMRFRGKEAGTVGYLQSNDGDALHVIEA